MVRHTFQKKEHLYSKKLIGQLVEKGNFFNLYPLHVKWMKAALKEKVNVQIAFTVPKRSFKRAVDRNKLKRRMREAYRLNKELLQVTNTAILVVYTGKKQELYPAIEKSLKNSMLKITKSVPAADE